jgi:RNA polymerase sigma-70 factor (ECF subfamily)
MQVISDDIIRRAVNGDQDAQFRLYEWCYPHLMSVAMRYYNSGEEAKDIVSISFTKIVLSMSLYQGAAPFDAWVRRICINACIDDYRKKKRQLEHVDQVDDWSRVQVSGGQHVENQAESDMSYEVLLSLIQQLPLMQRQVFNMFAIDGYSHAEISTELQITVGTSKWYLSSARKRLQVLIQTVN